VIPIPGTKSPKYLRENVMAGDLVLSDEDLVMLNGAPAPEGSRY
jgi:aryl-alcohol dehydrogenase-like predicted oxidoreductase